jgi:hypothetical protein
VTVLDLQNMPVDEAEQADVAFGGDSTLTVLGCD